MDLGSIRLEIDEKKMTEIWKRVKETNFKYFL